MTHCRNLNNCIKELGTNPEASFFKHGRYWRPDCDFCHGYEPVEKEIKKEFIPRKIYKQEATGQSKKGGIAIV